MPKAARTKKVVKEEEPAKSVNAVPEAAIVSAVQQTPVPEPAPAEVPVNIEPPATPTPMQTVAAPIEPPVTVPAEIPTSVENLARVGMTEPVTTEETPQEDKPGGGKKALMMILMLLLGMIVGSGVGYAVWGLKLVSKFMKKPAVTTSVIQTDVKPENTPAPTTAMEAKLNRADLKLQVLNGSGTAGAAGKAKDFLEGLGYKDVQTGNADKDNVAKTFVSIKTGKKDFLQMLSDDLKSNYTLGDSATLSAASQYDAVVTVGVK